MGLVIVPSESVLAEPSKLYAYAVQLVPVVGTHDGSPVGKLVELILAVGGLFVTVSVEPAPETGPVIPAPALLTKITLLMENEYAAT